MARVSDAVVYGILRSIDAFFFESLSLYDLLKKLYVSLLRQARVETGQQPHNSFQILVQQTETTVGFNWRNYLEQNRHLFMHETAPYLAVAFNPANAGQRKLVIESNPDVYLRIGDFDNVLKGSSLLIAQCRDDLIKKINGGSGLEPRRS